ncbi:MAG TPA: hypothetical protein VLA21_10300 [Candidatus Limnocylindria bacterium]|nr:hypothetical protein [Candidatus Limnocylindria bacterium]
MIAGLMETVYQNLAAGMSCPVTRAWPARDALAPSLTFRLSGWRQAEDGAGEAEVEALARAASPAQGDALSREAEDGAEGEGGVFVRRLAFRAPLFAGEIAPLGLTVNFNLGNAARLGGAFTAVQEPAEAAMLPRGLLSGPVTLTPGRAGAGAVRIRAGYLPGDAARDAIAAHFAAGTLMPCALTRGAGVAAFSAYVAAFAHTPLGFEALLRISAN